MCTRHSETIVPDILPKKVVPKIFCAWILMFWFIFYICHLEMDCQKIVIYGSPWNSKEWFGGSHTVNDTNKTF